ncbi:MAG: peptidase C45 [Acidobacteria bacterium]|nr:peptidase C45 [Acidobacteriota bacterium]
MPTSRRRLLLALGSAPLTFARDAKPVELKGALRKSPKHGWHHVVLAGDPHTIGFQHGYLLSNEIANVQRIIAVEMKHDTEKDWDFYRKAGREFFWPKVEKEYQEEIQGIADGVKARGGSLDVWDIVALNAWLEWSPYFLNWYNKRNGVTSPPTAVAADRCSAFVATGSYTKDRRPVMGHNAWTGYTNGAHWNIIFDVRPSQGKRFLMDGYPGLIHSGDDFGMNTAGIMITETTITQFDGFNPEGIPEFMRARKALQYSGSIDDFATIMKTGNNGGYANCWLVTDNKTGEIGSLELGLKNVTLQRTMDGYFCGANFPVNEKLAKEETTFDMANKSLSPNARRVRWEELMKVNRGRIDAAMGQRFLSDHVDSLTGKTEPNERTLCGHVELSPRGMKPWQPEYGAAGAVQAKVTTAALAGRLTMYASMGHPCGLHFRADEHLRKHPEFAWQKPILGDLRSNPWTRFEAVR